MSVRPETSSCGDPIKLYFDGLDLDGSIFSKLFVMKEYFFAWPRIYVAFYPRKLQFCGVRFTVGFLYLTDRVCLSLYCTNGAVPAHTAKAYGTLHVCYV